jgi:hypothetical protein
LGDPCRCFRVGRPPVLAVQESTEDQTGNQKAELFHADLQ